jgi:capsular polysaccharide biosynthesis protein
MKDGFMLQQEEMGFKSIDLMAYVNIAWKRRWQIIIPTVVIAVLAGIVSFLLPKIWEVDAIIIPSKFLSQTAAGEFKEILVAPPAQIAGQISQRTYDNLIAAELNIDPRAFPRINAENLRNTNLIRVYVRGKDPHRGRMILLSLFNHLKSDFDKKIDVEFSKIGRASCRERVYSYV